MRSIVATAIVLVAIFAAGLVAGFVHAHEPERDELVLTIDREPLPAEGATVVSGEIVSIDGARITLRTAAGLVELDLAPGLPLEELTRAGLVGLDPGEAVNIGGERTNIGLVLTGVVGVETP